MNKNCPSKDQNRKEIFFISSAIKINVNRILPWRRKISFRVSHKQLHGNNTQAIIANSACVRNNMYVIIV